MPNNRQSITASAPGKLMLSVGYAVVHGYSTVVTAVDQRLYATVEKNGSGWFNLDAPDLGIVGYSKRIEKLGNGQVPKSVKFIEIFYKHFFEKYPQEEGVSVSTSSDFSATYGFGSSSAVTVAFAKALLTLYDIPHTNEELFEMTYKVILEVQGVGSGYDLAAAIWGGTLRYVKPAKVVSKIEIEDLPIMVGYTGEKADTPTLIRVVNSSLRKKPNQIKDIFEEINNIALEQENALKNKDWAELGNLFKRSQVSAQKLAVSSTRIEELVGVAEKAGALGATSSGAAGGDCVLVVVEKDKQKEVAQAWKKIGVKVIKVGLNAEGVRVEK